MKHDLAKNLNEMLANRCMEHIREGNVEKANKYVRQMKELLDASLDHIDNLESLNANV